MVVRRLREPALTLEFEERQDTADVQQPAEYAFWPEGEGPYDYMSHWVRPRVTNARGGVWGRDSARDVEVLIERVEAHGARRNAPARPESEDRLKGLPLQWSELETTKVDLPPGVERRFDLCHVDNIYKEKDDKHPLRHTPIRFDVRPLPEAKYHRVFGDRYRVTLALTARDLDASYYAMEIAYDGKRRNHPEKIGAALEAKAVPRFTR
jgi:hypothetical protein